jgi:NDP-sugar pyrophosphorylase family protein
LVELSDEPLLVINGDVLTEIDFRAMLAYHREHNSKLTVAVQSYSVEVPYGVVETEGLMLKRLVEKPSLEFLVNAGIYLLEPEVCRFVSKSDRLDMTDLIQSILDQGWPVIVFPIREYWTDIGQHSDYEQAQEHMINQVSSK